MTNTRRRILALSIAFVAALMGTASARPKEHSAIIRFFWDEGTTTPLDLKITGTATITHKGKDITKHFKEVTLLPPRGDLVLFGPEPCHESNQPFRVKSTDLTVKSSSNSWTDQKIAGGQKYDVVRDALVEDGKGGTERIDALKFPGSNVSFKFYVKSDDCELRTAFVCDEQGSILACANERPLEDDADVEQAPHATYSSVCTFDEQPTNSQPMGEVILETESDDERFLNHSEEDLCLPIFLRIEESTSSRDDSAGLMNTLSLVLRLAARPLLTLCSA